jgi:hypothetical protein
MVSLKYRKREENQSNPRDEENPSRDNPVLTRFLVPIHCLKIPAQVRGDEEAAIDEESHTKDEFHRLFR